MDHLSGQAHLLTRQSQAKLNRNKASERLGANDSSPTQAEIDHGRLKLLCNTQSHANFLGRGSSHTCSPGVKSILSETVLGEQLGNPTQISVDMELDTDVPSGTARADPTHGDCGLPLSSLSGTIGQNHLHLLTAAIGRTADSQTIGNSLDLDPASIEAEINQLSRCVVLGELESNRYRAQNTAVSSLLTKVSSFTQ